MILKTNDMNRNFSAAVLAPDELEHLLHPEFRSKNKIVFTNGCFDILHAGHIHYLKEAALLGSVLIIGLNSDDSVTRLKGEGRPLNPQVARATMLTALRMVDYVVIFEEDTPYKLIEKVRPDFLVKGGDYKAEEIVGYGIVSAYGGRVVTIPFLEGFSSSSLISRMK